MFLKIITAQLLYLFFFLIIRAVAQVQDSALLQNGNQQRHKQRASSFSNDPYILTGNSITTLPSCPQSSSVCRADNYVRFDIIMRSSLSDFPTQRVQKFKQYLLGFARFSSQWTDQLKDKHINVIGITQPSTSQIMISGNVYYQSQIEANNALPSLLSSAMDGSRFDGNEILGGSFAHVGPTPDSPNSLPVEPSEDQSDNSQTLMIILSAVFGSLGLIIIVAIIIICCCRRSLGQNQQSKNDQARRNGAKESALSQGEIIKQNDEITSRGEKIKPIYLKKSKIHLDEKQLKVIKQSSVKVTVD